MAARPIEPGAVRAGVDRTFEAAGLKREPEPFLGRGGQQDRVVEQAAGEGREEPVDAEAQAELTRAGVQTLGCEGDDPDVQTRARRQLAVAGEQHAYLRAGAPEQLTVGLSRVSDRGIMARRAQPAAQAPEHLVAQEPQGLGAR